MIFLGGIEIKSKIGLEIILWRESSWSYIFVTTLLCVGLASCYPATSVQTKTTSFHHTITPSSSFSPTISTNTVLVQSTQIPSTRPPESMISTTETPNNCPFFKFDTKLPNPDLPENYIGYHLNNYDLPAGLEEIGGVLLYDENFENELVLSEYYWHEIRRIFFLKKMLCRDESGRAYFEVVDALGTPILSGDETEPWVCFTGETQLNFSGGFGVYDENLPKEKIGDFEGWPYTKLVFLFFIDFPNQKLIQLDVKGVKCMEGGRR